MDDFAFFERRDHACIDVQRHAVLFAQMPQDGKIWAAWGTIIEKRPYLWTCLEDMIALGREYGAQWVTCGRRSKAGHPHHPLYLRADSVTEPFDPEAYVLAQQARAAAAVSGLMADGAAFIASGIIDTRKDEVIAGLEQAGLAVVEVKEKRGWECIVCKKA